MNHERHIHLIAWFHIIVGMLSLIILVIVLMFGTAIGLAGLTAIHDSPTSKTLPIAGFFSIFYMIFLFCLAISAVPDLLVGWGLLNRKTWARYLGIILSMISLFNFPVGTMLGLYTIWALWSRDANPYFERRYLVDYEYAR